MNEGEVIRQWSVVRFQNGSWMSSGNSLEQSGLEGCEVFHIWATTRGEAKAKAQRRRGNRVRKARQQALTTTTSMPPQGGISHSGLK